MGSSEYRAATLLGNLWNQLQFSTQLLMPRPHIGYICTNVAYCGQYSNVWTSLWHHVNIASNHRPVFNTDPRRVGFWNKFKGKGNDREVRAGILGRMSRARHTLVCHSSQAGATVRTCFLVVYLYLIIFEMTTLSTEWSNEHVSEFIELYQGEPAIWKSTNKFHKNRNVLADDANNKHIMCLNHMRKPLMQISYCP